MEHPINDGVLPRHTQNIKINQQAKNGYTALMLASRWGQKEMVKMLKTKEKETKY